MVEVNWSGCFPCLCSGSWSISVDGVDYTDHIPEHLREDPMGTLGTYYSWHFEDWDEVWENYVDGLDFDEWCEANPWINSIPASHLEIFTAFQEKDWRHGQCGGCI